jgi:DNA-binding transcriptional MerR regulator
MNGDTLLTLDELCAQVAVALVDGYAGAPNDRVRDLPDARTVRYYGTLGLLDRPTIQGRTAYYGRRHLLQLVAIKRLQTNGLSLGEVQERLLSRSDAELAKLARLSQDADVPDAPRVKSARRSAFWKEIAAEPAPAAVAGEKPLQAVRLSDDVMLLVPLTRTPDEFDLQAVRAAAGPLLKLLRTRKLIEG